MINSFTLTNYLGESIKMELKNPMKTGFVIRSVNGLGPVKAHINTTELATNDGALYNSARLNQRNIVFDIVFDDSNESIEDLRRKTYKYFPLKKKIDIVVETDKRTAKISGYVESNEPNIFSSQEGTQISVICPDPYFYSVGDDGSQQTIITKVISEFEFPFSNESTSQPLIVMGNIDNHNTLDCVIDYQGDAEIGMTITMRFSGSVGNITLTKTDTQQYMKLEVGRLTIGAITDGDEIVICTLKGKKSVTLNRNGQSNNILNCVDMDADWFMLSNGDNHFEVSVSSGTGNLHYISFENEVVYTGV